MMTFEELENMRLGGKAPFPEYERFHKIMDELSELHDKKGKDYGNGKDPYANICSSSEFSIEPWKFAMLRANEKVTRIKTFACTGTLANEGVIDSFNDLAVLAVIARVLFERSRQ